MSNNPDIIVKPSQGDVRTSQKAAMRSEFPQGFSPAQEEQVTPVTIELISNWGHPSRVGLTEIQLFDSSRKKIVLHVDELSINGAVNVKGDLGALINGKVKTTKERNMYSCEFKPQSPVSITIAAKIACNKGEILRNNQTKNILQQLKIWNYNRSVGEASMGARLIRITVGGRGVVWEGEVEKGTGNQIFEYGKTIDLCEGNLICCF